MKTAEQKELTESIVLVKGMVNEAVNEHSYGKAQNRSVFRETCFTRVFLNLLEDLGQVSDTTDCHFDCKVGRGIGKINAWGLDELEGIVTLVSSIHRGLPDDPEKIPRKNVQNAIDRAVRVFEAAGRGYHEKMEPASDNHDMMQLFHQHHSSIHRARVIVLVDGVVEAKQKLKTPSSDEFEVQVDIWDHRRLHRAKSSGRSYEPLEIDLTKRLGNPLPCIAPTDLEADYKVYLAAVPGDLLHELYHEFGPRLLELNVRSFLQARGKVNKGIRATLQKEPARFMAYNNGISATAEDIEVTKGPNGLAITKLVGLQVVNGGQTVASIHRAKDRDKFDLKNVFVQMKLTIVERDQVETLVPLISRYANTQNRINEADFSANHPFHVKLQQLSQSIWAPGEQSRWFYERARGQYQVALQREKTPARQKKFRQTTPSFQRFDKVKIAKYVNSWEQLPHVVSLGSQKNFVVFMQEIGKREPDSAYFQKVVAQAIIFKCAEKAARAHKLPSYKANAITYTIALIAYRTAGGLDLMKIWEQQAVPKALADTISKWLPIVHEKLIVSAKKLNVTEWCKKQECWDSLRKQKLKLPAALEKELMPVARSA